MTTTTPTGRPTHGVDSTSPLTCGDGNAATTTVTPFPSHLSSPHGPALRCRLSDRDLSVLQTLGKVRLMTGAQIQRLQIAEGSAATRSRRARALLQRLTDLKLVVRLGRRVGGVRAGSSGFIYGLSGRGQAMLGLDGPCGGRHRRVWEVSPSFGDHVLCVSELYVSLVEAERAGALELLDFDAEPACWRRFPGSQGQAVTLKPDAFVNLGLGEYERSAFIEVDMGTESAPTITRKCAVYVEYWQAGVEQRERGVFPSVLWLASSQRGAERIAEVVNRLPDDARRLFEVTLQPDAVITLTTTAQGGRDA